MSAPVSVLISTFNRAAYLSEAIESILNQSIPPVEILIMNDGSTDNTSSLLSAYTPRVAAFHQNNKGKSAALNFLASRSTQDFIWIFDDDDVALPDAIERHLAVFRADPRADFTYSPHIQLFPDGSTKYSRLPSSISAGLNDGYLFHSMLRGCVISQQGMLVKSEAFHFALPYREDLDRSLDYEFLTRLTRHYRGILVPDPTFYLRIHDGARGTAKNRFRNRQRHDRWYKANQKIFEKLFRELPLHEYLPGYNGSYGSSCSDVREAIISRMSIMGKKGLWSLVIDDVQKIGQLDSGIEEADLVMRYAPGMFEGALSNKELLLSSSRFFKIRKFVRSHAGIPGLIVCSRKIYHCFPGQWREGRYLVALALILASICFCGFKGLFKVVKNKFSEQDDLKRFN